MRSYISNLSIAIVSLLTLSFSGAIVPSTVSAQTGGNSAPTKIVDLFRQDFADCVNSNVVQSRSPDRRKSEGAMRVTKSEFDGKLFVEATLLFGTPNTKYNIFLKCHQKIGELFTNNNGLGKSVSLIPLSAVPAIFAFDIYPDGAPLGNKFQSGQIKF
jgi:hypothetical protein